MELRRILDMFQVLLQKIMPLLHLVIKVVNAQSPYVDEVLRKLMAFHFRLISMFIDNDLLINESIIAINNYILKQNSNCDIVTDVLLRRYPLT